jgi:hypothetical protein
MIRAYSQRILPPYSGVVQIAESERIRAQSFDGLNWQIQYLPDRGSDGKRVRGYGLDRGYYDIATLDRGQLKTFLFPKFLDPDEVTEGIDELVQYLSSAAVPFPIADLHELWLLDASDDSPLALIYSCCDESQMDTFSSRNEWTALPHSKLDVENTEAERSRSEPPVNHRLQHMVSRRAGGSPRAAWFKRDGNGHEVFPPLLIREDWQDPVEHELCQRYLDRKAPRLLLLQGISKDDRERLEVAAKQQVFEVEQYFQMYPEVNDERRMKAMRVEARLRRTAPQVSAGKAKRSGSVNKELSKDMRIIET